MFTEKDIDKAWDDYLKRKYDPPSLFYTGKQGKINYETHFMKKCGAPGESIDIAKRMMEQTLPNKLFKI